MWALTAFPSRQVAMWLEQQTLALQDLRMHMESAKQQHVESLRRVQDICLEAERRAEQADRYGKTAVLMLSVHAYMW